MESMEEYDAMEFVLVLGVKSFMIKSDVDAVESLQSVGMYDLEVESDEEMDENVAIDAWLESQITLLSSVFDRLAMAFLSLSALEDMSNL
jgi:hypothetical protein